MPVVVPAADLEREWRAWLVARNRRGMFAAAVLVAVLHAIFAVLDGFIAPRQWLPLLLAVRLAGEAWTLFMFFVLRRPTFDRSWPIWSSTYMAGVALSLSVMTVVLGGFASPYYAGLSLVMIGAGLLFVWPREVVVLTHGSIVLGWALLDGVLAPETFGLFGATSALFLASTALIVAAGQILGYRTSHEQVAARMTVEVTKATLEGAHERLKQLDRFKSQFFANITHELKTPLALILSPLELMLDGELGELSEAQRASLRSMFRSGAKLLKLIGDLLDLSKIEESHLRIAIKEHDAVAWVRGLVSQVEPLTQRKQIELVFRPDAPRAEVWFDAERMERVLVNLLSNAAKFTEPGGHIEVAVRDREDEVEIAVTDDGVGFPPELADRLFERFYQVDMAGTRKHGGTGIGLALAREIVELHGGRITAQGTPGEGASFRVVLKKGRDHFRAEALDRRAGRKDSQAQGKRSTDRSAAEWATQITSRDDFRLLEIADATDRRLLPRDPDEHRRQHTVLVVEDTPDVVRVIHLALRQDFRVFAATDGAKGLELALREAPSLIITDLMMPEVDGLELTRRLRADPRTKHVPIIMLTARGDLSDRLAGLETGVSAYLTKPFSPKELLGTVRALLEKEESTADLLLEQRMGSLETIAGALAHQINNPLNYVKNALARVKIDVDALEREVRAGAPDPARLAQVEARIAKMFVTAESGVSRIGETVELMGRYSREGFTRALRPHDLFGAARDVLALLVPTSGRDIAAASSFDGDGTVECVPEEMHQVLTNLIQNAMDAVADGTGHVEVRGRSDASHVVLEVHDDGVGITPEDRARIFAPFYTTKGPGSGMGLGLTITWRVVHALGGSVQVESEPGQGTTMILRLPRRSAATAPLGA